MNLYDYVAHSSPNEANILLSKYGLANTNDCVLISDRLKAIVRRDKSQALEEIVNIHPDKDLIFKFNNSGHEEFLNVTGRTPNFDNSNEMFENEDEMFDNSSSILDNQMADMTPPPPPIPIVIPTPVTPVDNEGVKTAIKELKNENKREREKIKVDRRNRQKMASLNQTSVLMCVVAFAIGYMIGNKK